MKSIKRPIILALALLLSSISIAGQKPKDDPCPNAQTQFEMNQCAGNAYRTADAELNQVYRKLAATLDTEEKALLKVAQTAWLKYRDAHCEFVGDQYKGGTMRPMVHGFCLADVTRNRTTELKGEIENRDQ